MSGAAAASPNCSSSDALRPRHRGSIRLKHRLALAPTRPAERAGEASALPFPHYRFDVARSAQLQPTWPVRRIWPLSEVSRAFDLGVACRSRLTALPRPSATTWSPRSWWSLAILAPSADRRNIISSGLSDMGKTRSASPQGRPQGAPSHKAIHASPNQMPMPASAHMPPRHAHRPSHCGYAAVLFRASLRSRREAIEAAIHGLEPELRLPATNQRPNPVFTRNEITRLALPPRGCLAAATDQEDDAGAAAGRSRGAGEA
jgi:hypothetical protein